jgi:hypothetical protein
VLIETVIGKLNQPRKLQVAEAFMILIDKELGEEEIQQIFQKR